MLLDGDALLINRVNDLLGKKFDIGLTLRSKDERFYKKYYCYALYSGVIYFNSCQENHLLFLKKWIDQMENTFEPYLDQTSLTRLLQENRINQKFNIGELIQRKMDEHVINFKMLSTEKYNYTKVRSGFDHKRNRIIHMKGTRDLNDYLSQIEKIHGNLDFKYF